MFYSGVNLPVHSLPPYLYSLWHCLEQLGQLAEAIVGDSTLAPEVVMVGRDELVELHLAEGHVTQQLPHLQSHVTTVRWSRERKVASSIPKRW